MIAAMLLAAQVVAATPAPQTAIDAGPARSAIDAERAFAADAQARGQWTAFKAWSTPDALMFTPQPVKAHDFLKNSKDPPIAVFWWPGASYVSCDGSVAINTGPWVREWGKSVGYFTTVWVRQPDGGWKWIYDGGDTLRVPRAQGGDIRPRVAACATPRPLPPAVEAATAAGRNAKSAEGRSKDGTLRWQWTVKPDGTRDMIVRMWAAIGWQVVVNDHVAAPPE